MAPPGHPPEFQTPKWDGVPAGGILRSTEWIGYTATIMNLIKNSITTTKLGFWWITTTGWIPQYQTSRNHPVATHQKILLTTRHQFLILSPRPFWIGAFIIRCKWLVLRDFRGIFCAWFWCITAPGLIVRPILFYYRSPRLQVALLTYVRIASRLPVFLRGTVSNGGRSI